MNKPLMGAVLTAALCAPNAFAISNLELARTCQEVGKQKIAAQAAAWNCEVDLNQTAVQEIDNRWYNPSKYIWYQAPSECNGHDRIIKLVQYYRGRCF